MFELEIVTDIDDCIGQNAQYSGNISGGGASSKGGMLFRLRHLNSGRLLVMQELDIDENTRIKSTGLAEHLDVTVSYKQDKGREKVLMTSNSPSQQYKLEANSIFRLVSTGVDADNRIRIRTSV